MRTAPPHIHIAAGRPIGEIYIRTEETLVSEAQHHHSGFNKVLKFKDVDDKYSYKMYGFYEDTIKEVVVNSSVFVQYIGDVTGLSAYAGFKSRFGGYFATPETGFGAYSSDFAVSTVNEDFEATKAIVFKRQETITQKIVDKNWEHRDYDSFDYSIMDATPNGTFMVGNYLSRNAMLPKHDDAYHRASALLKVQGDSVVKAISFDQQNNYEYGSYYHQGSGKWYADYSNIFKTINQGPLDDFAFWVNGSWLESLLETDSHIFVGGELMGAGEYGLKEGKAYSFVEIEQDIPPDSHSIYGAIHNTQDLPYKYTGINTAGEEVAVTGGIIRPRIHPDNRDASLAVSLKDSHHYTECYGDAASTIATSGVHSGFHNGYTSNSIDVVQLSRQLGAVIKFDKSLAVVIAQLLVPVSNPFDSDLSLGRTRTIVPMGGSVFQVMNGHYSVQVDYSPKVFTSVAKWNEALTELEMCKTIGNAINFMANDTVEHDGLLYLVGSAVHSAATNAVVVVMDSDLTVVHAKICYVEDHKKYPNYSGEFRSLLEGITINVIKGRPMLTCTGTYTNGYPQGGIVTTLDITDDWKVIDTKLTNNRDITDLVSVVATETDIVGVGTAYDKATGAGGATIRLDIDGATHVDADAENMEELGIFSGDVTLIEVPLTVEDTPATGLNITEYVRSIVADETFTTSTVSHANVGGEFV